MIEQIKKLIFDDDLIEKIADKAMVLQGKENTTLPLLKKQYADTQKSIDNMLDAIQQGILTASTKERLESLEKQKSELSVQIVKEEMAKPMLSREQIVFWFHRFRKLDAKKLEHRRRLIDSFVNAIILYDDRITFTFNYKDGSKTITFAELEKSGLGSDISALAAPYRVFLTNLRVGCGHSISFCLHFVPSCMYEQELSCSFYYAGTHKQKDCQYPGQKMIVMLFI